ncbi:hypothetical protein T03_8586, partial [Trichinella britovi]
LKSCASSYDEKFETSGNGLLHDLKKLIISFPDSSKKSCAFVGFLTSIIAGIQHIYMCIEKF